MKTTYIGLGSNLQDPHDQIDAALDSISRHKQLKLISVASYYQSPAMVLDEMESQPDYINTVARVETTLEALVLLSALQTIETQQGRIRSDKRWRARTLDLDILLYGDLVINQPTLTIPHPGICERAFVLYPLYELCPTLSIPGKGVLTELIMQFESKKTSAKLAGKAGGVAVNLVKLRSR